MKEFLTEDFLLQTKTAQTLYHEHAQDMPIIDYHCHLPPEDIANDRQFQNLTAIWLEGDHYKWRAMRTNGVPERYCTGDAPAQEKFRKWAETVPYTLRNPLYHWTHMELQKPFGVHQILNGSTADEIYQECTEKLQTPEFSVRSLMLQRKVEVVCTVDDPVDSLEHHRRIRESDFAIKVLPTFRPDKAMAVESTASFNQYVDQLAEVAGTDISSFAAFMEALQERHDFFHENGCRLSDHGLETIYAEDFTEEELKKTFNKIRGGKDLQLPEILQFKSALLLYFGQMDHAKGWAQQYHLGALRNNSLRMLREIGPDTGFDSIGDFEMGRPLARFLGRLDDQNQLARTILYNLNPADNYLFGTMIGNFQDGTVPGKLQFGSGWWFLDQKEAMEWQLNALSNLGLLSRFIGMLTDSRSFLSYSRHEYFRRILCNLIGRDVENGEIPADMELLGTMVRNICYHNAKGYFNFE
jgi:glucuronate isomerase